jgi:hypothetical protein
MQERQNVNGQNGDRDLGESTRLPPELMDAVTAPEAIGDDDYGQRVGRIITPKDLLEGRQPFDVISGMGKGERLILGHLRGVVNSTERKTTAWQGKDLESVWLNGEFEMVIGSTGEVKAAPTAILPKAFGITVETALAAMHAEDGSSPTRGQLQIDCSIGLETTGRPIPYEWVVIYYREGRAQKAMREVRARQEARIAREARLIKALPNTTN